MKLLHLLFLPVVLCGTSEIPDQQPARPPLLGPEDGTFIRRTFGLLFKKQFVTTTVTYEETVAQLSQLISTFASDLSVPKISDAIDEAILYRYAVFCGLSYCDTEQDTSKVTGFKIGGRLLFSGNFEVFKWETLNAYKSWFGTHFYNDLLYYIVAAHDSKEIVIVFRGTVNLYNQEADIDLRRVQLSELKTDQRFTSEKCRVPDSITEEESFFSHKGFIEMFPVNVLQEIDQQLTNAIAKFPGYDLIITGHSLGASLAALYGLHWSAIGKEFNAVLTYEQPIVGSLLFNNFLASCIGHEKLIRITSSDDIVPWINYAKMERIEDTISHADGVKEIYFPDPKERGIVICVGADNIDCSAKVNFGDRTWDHHSVIGGLPISSSLCLLGQGPKSKVSSGGFAGLKNAAKNLKNFLKKT